MSEENVEVARRLYTDQPFDLVTVFSDPALLDAVRSQVEPVVHADFETVFDPHPTPVGDLGDVRGVDGFITAWAGFLSAWDSWVVKPEEFIDVDEHRVLVLLDVQARSKTHKVDIPVPSANLLTLREGKIARVELFTTKGAALEAAGLSEDDAHSSSS
jgi:hypothetical protein